MALSIDNIKRGLTTDPIRTFKFLVTITPNTDDGKWDVSKWNQMGFVSLSGLTVSTEPIAYREGGYNTNVHQIPGQSFHPYHFVSWTNARSNTESSVDEALICNLNPGRYSWRWSRFSLHS